MKRSDIRFYLEQKTAEYNKPEFIIDDPISVPHLFKKKQDIEIIGFFSAILAWGQRKTIISKCKQLAELMDHAPHDFMIHHTEKDLSRFAGFKHRTFNDTDLLYFIHFFEYLYKKYDSLEAAFVRANLFSDQSYLIDANDAGDYLNNFRKNFFSLPYFPERTKKHVSSPEQKSTCKRLNMFLRWMVRKDSAGVDFGIWSTIKPSQLICPIDLHVDRIARKLKLIESRNLNWNTALELTTHLRSFDSSDPVKYDFALYGMGLEERYLRNQV